MMIEQSLMSGAVPSIEKVARGQKLMIYAIVLFLATPLVGGAASVGLRNMNELLVWTLLAFSLFPYFLGIFGFLRLASGMGYGELTKLCLLGLLLVPLVNVLILILINGSATRALKGAGYSVGLLGTKQPTTPRAISE